MKKYVVIGAGGFIGGHLVRNLLCENGVEVVAIDNLPLVKWKQVNQRSTNIVLDARDTTSLVKCLDRTSWVFNLAANAGGMEFISSNDALCLSSVEIAVSILRACTQVRVERYFFASSACVYPISIQGQTGAKALAEDDCTYNDPQNGYGWEKAYSELMTLAFSKDHGLHSRIARLHNVYGPYCEINTIREKAPAALCRKVIECQLGKHNVITLWGDGNQERSFLYIDDCIDGIIKLMHSSINRPLNIGDERSVSIIQLCMLLQKIAGTSFPMKFDRAMPQGVRSRNCDASNARRLLDWCPSTLLEHGLTELYTWMTKAERDEVTILE